DPAAALAAVVPLQPRQGDTEADRQPLLLWDLGGELDQRFPFVDAAAPALRRRGRWRQLACCLHRRLPPPSRLTYLTVTRYPYRVSWSLIRSAVWRSPEYSSTIGVSFPTGPPAKASSRCQRGRRTGISLPRASA